MTEIKEGKIEEVNDQNDLRPDEMGSDEEHDKSKLQEIVEYEVRSNSCCSVNMGSLVREEVPHVTDLEEEEYNPGS